MREADYNSALNQEIEEEIGGRCIKLAEKVNLGIPDTMHIKNGIVTFIEVKIGEKWLEIPGYKVVRPWDSVNDLRQYEVCRKLAKHSLVLYVIYYPEIEMTAVLTMGLMEVFSSTRGTAAAVELYEGQDFTRGHGVERIAELMKIQRRGIYEKL